MRVDLERRIIKGSGVYRIKKALGLKDMERFGGKANKELRVED